MRSYMRSYTRQEVADILRVTTRTVDRLIRVGDLKAFRVGRAVRVPEEALRAFIGAP